jgi:hypothetical protein
LCLGHFVMDCFVCVSCGRLEGNKRHCPSLSLCAVCRRLEVGVIVICSVCVLSRRLGGRLDGRRHCPVLVFMLYGSLEGCESHCPPFSLCAVWKAGRR